MKLYTLAEASVLIGRSHSTLRHQAQKGRLNARLVGKTWTVTERDIQRYVEQVKRPEREA